MICNADYSFSWWGFIRGGFKGRVIKVNVTYLIYFFSYPSFRDSYKATKSWLSVLHKYTHSENIDAFGWFINILAHLFNLFQIFPSSNFKHQKIVSLSKIRMLRTSVFCQCESVSSCFFKQLNIAASSLCQRP